MTLGQRNLLLLVLVLLLAGIPAAFALGWLPSPLPDAAWSGGDTQLTETVGTLQEDYQPWFESLFSPGDYERYLFGFQAFLGALALSGFLGWMIGRRQALTGEEGSERQLATVVAAVGIVLFVVLFFVETELGELQAFFSALQGIGLGTLGYFAGYAIGRRSSVAHTAGPARTAGTTGGTGARQSVV
jgi:cobalt/nickel transport protein